MIVSDHLPRVSYFARKLASFRLFQKLTTMTKHKTLPEETNKQKTWNVFKKCTGCFFYFGMFDIVIFWSIFDQKSCSWAFFISTFRSYFVKKITEHLCHYFSFYRIFRKATNFGEISKIITFLKKLQQNCHNFMISTKILIKIAFFNSKHCKQYIKYQKSFNLILKLVKIIIFLIKKWKNDIFSKILKIGTFTKTRIKCSVFKIFSPNFF